MNHADMYGCCKFWHYPEQHAAARGVPGDEKHDEGCTCWCRTTPLPDVLLLSLSGTLLERITPRAGTTMQDWHYASHVERFDLTRAHEMAPGVRVQLLGIGGMMARDFSAEGFLIRYTPSEGATLAIWEDNREPDPAPA